MVSAGVLQLLGLACLASALPARGNDNAVMIFPQSPVLEIGSNFTATCMIINTADVTAKNLFWKLSNTIIPKEQYTRVNSSTVNVTIQITNEGEEWLYCRCNSSLAKVVHNGKFMHGILLKKGHRPQKPENLTCVALQEKNYISKTMTCQWDAPGPQSSTFPIEYTLYLVVHPGSSSYNVTTTEKTVKIDAGTTFPNHMELEIWVEAHNTLGSEESEHLKKDAGYFVKTNPPTAVSAITEQSFSTSVLMNWTHPLHETYLVLMYQIRFRANDSQNWTYVPLEEITKNKHSFRIQNLQPDTLYITQVRCKNSKDYDNDYWSEWSHIASNRTPEARPTGGPDLWMVVYKGGGINGRRVQLLCKDPALSNGKIIWFDIKIHVEKGQVKNESSEWERINVSRSDEEYSSTQRRITVLKEIPLADGQSIRVDVKAANSAGESDKTSIVIPERVPELHPVEGLKVWSHGGQLWLKWNHPKRQVSGYLVEWVTGDQMDWQRETRNTTQTTIKGNLEKYVRYTVSVYPIYTKRAGKAASVEAYLEQGVPLEGPTVTVDGKAGRNRAKLTWNAPPPHISRGFITNYTIFYSSDTEKRNKTVPANTTSYTLTSLSPNTKYQTRVSVSTIAGSTVGSISHSFTTSMYEDGMIELIVVGVSLGFLSVVIMAMMLCACKKDAIKRNFWPQIPNPGESTIGNWSPDYPLKAEATKESSLSGISVLDVCDTKSVFEEDKTSLPLKKDKFLSEDHSSGIGGSSCMSSPRQSVSDSDEGGDIPDTTASTVQYSSVVASSGYKGQTPSSQAQQAIFSRSESTQPLLDSEENPDVLVHERFPRQPCFARAAGTGDGASQLEAEQQVMLEPLDFCSLEEDSETANTDEQSADWLPAAPASSYMPQLGGYRPQ